jgi:3-deoxy-D-arabino-heptulosonate 7-phosphate (DAHP) synthase
VSGGHESCICSLGYQNMNLSNTAVNYSHKNTHKHYAEVMSVRLSVIQNAVRTASICGSILGTFII